MFPTAIETIGEHGERRLPVVDAGPSATSKNRTKTTNAAAFVATAMNAVIGVGAPW